MAIETAGGTMFCPVTGANCTSLGFVYEAEPTGDAIISVEDGLRICEDMHDWYRREGLVPLLECGILFKALGELVYQGSENA